MFHLILKMIIYDQNNGEITQFYFSLTKCVFIQEEINVHVPQTDKSKNFHHINCQS